MHTLAHTNLTRTFRISTNVGIDVQKCWIHNKYNGSNTLKTLLLYTHGQHSTVHVLFGNITRCDVWNMSAYGMYKKRKS